MCYREISPPDIQNLVVHFRLPKEDLPLLLRMPTARGFLKSSRNFYVHRSPSTGTTTTAAAAVTKGGERKKRKAISFTVFPKRGSVIATGVGKESEIVDAIKTFARDSGAGVCTPPDEWERRTVNSTYVGRIINEVGIYRTLSAIRERIKEQNDTSISLQFRSQFFPGILIKWSGARGSVNVFDNGHYVVVGVRSDAEANILFEQLCALMRESRTTSTSEMSCARTADS